MEINSDWCQEIFWNCIEMIVTFLCTCGEKPSTTSQFFRIFLFWLLREERGGEHRTTLNAPYVQRFSVLSHFTSWHTRGGAVIPTGLVRKQRKPWRQVEAWTWAGLSGSGITVAPECMSLHNEGLRVWRTCVQSFGACCFSGSLLSQHSPVVGTADHHTFPCPACDQPSSFWHHSNPLVLASFSLLLTVLGQWRAQGSVPCLCLSFTSTTSRVSSLTPSLQPQPTRWWLSNAHTSSTGLSQLCELELTALLPRCLPWVSTDGSRAQPS